MVKWLEVPMNSILQGLTAIGSLNYLIVNVKLILNGMSTFHIVPV